MADDGDDDSGLFGGINEFVDRLTELADAAESLDEQVERSTDDDSGVQGVWGVRVRSGLGGDVDVSEFGNVRDEDDSDTVVVDDVREPMVDVFDEEDRILVVAEMPGAGPADLTLEIEGDLMVVGAETEEQTYQREVLLPEDCSERSPKVEASNGIFRIELPDPAAD